MKAALAALVLIIATETVMDTASVSMPPRAPETITTQQ